MKLVVGTPWSSPFMYTRYVDAMLDLQRPGMARKPGAIRVYADGACSEAKERLTVEFVRGEGWCPARRHIHICEQALQRGADLICIVGADQVHPHDMLVRLIDRWNEGYEIVSALVPARGYIEHMNMKPFQPMAWRIPPNEDGDLRIRRKSAEELVRVIDVADGEMQRVNFIGSGVLMFHRDHLKALKPPWFFETVDNDTCQRLACMDTKFVWRLQMEAGAKVWVDTSIKVKHIHPFEIDDTFQHRFDDWMENGRGAPDICQMGEIPT